MARQTSNNGSETVKIAAGGLLFLFSLCSSYAQASIATLAPAALKPTTVTLQGAVNPQQVDTTAWFEWGTGTNYEQFTPPQTFNASGNEEVFSQVLTGLGVSATYTFRAVASNNLGLVMGTNQTFVTPVFVPADIQLSPAYDGAVSWGDYNNDGLLDILLTGGIPMDVWRNTGVGFSNLMPKIDVSATASAAWGDYDCDGRLDLVDVGGVWRNTGSSFVAVNSGLPFVPSASFAWADFDSDGRPDILLLGHQVTQIWRNGGTRLLDINAGFPGFFGGAWLKSSGASIGDYDNDGTMDLLACGAVQESPFLSTRLWRNTENGFININAGLPGIAEGSLAWGDYDNDGRIDIALTGYSDSGPITQIWRNTGTGFTNINAALPGLVEGSVAWGDYDNDGRLDLLITGQPDWNSGDFVSDVWRNTTNGFVRVYAGLIPTTDGGTAWGDYDNDGRLDIVITGLTNADGSWYPSSQVWHNEWPVTNTPPNPPTNLTAALEGNTIVFRWGSGTDAETPASGLTYNLRVGTTPGGVDLVSPMSLSNGFRQVPRMGNVQEAHRFRLTRVPLNQPIYWSVQTVDTAFAGSPFAPEMNLRVNVSPGTPPGPTAGDLNGDGLVDLTDLSVMLRTLLASNPPPIFSVSAPTANRFQFGLPLLSPLNFSVLASTNLARWESIGPASLYFDFLDPDATNQPMLHYQLQLP